MNTTSQANSVSASPAATVWVKACAALKRELGEDTFGSWVAPASLLEGGDGALCVVTPTGIARDWIRRHAWRRLTEVWAENDPQGRRLDLKSRTEVDGFTAAHARPVAAAAPAEVVEIAPEPVIQAKKPTGLQDRFSFDTFVQGPTNEFAYAVARRVASWTDGHFNPVLFHGPFGFGKTHLLQALAAEAARNRPDKTVIYMTADRFLSGFVKAVMDRQTSAFKEELRAADLLIIDDVHFIGGKQATQEELFHTLVALMGDGRRVVMSADRAPGALTELEPRLRSHLASGLVCGIEASDRNHRLGILERKLELLCRQQGLQIVIKPEVLVFLADRFTDSVRELEGALNTLVARAGAGLAHIGLEEAQAVIRPHLKAGEKRITVDDIQKATAEHFGLKQADLLSERRTRSVARPRQAAMWLAKQLTVRSLPDIGRRFGGRDHTTVLHAVRRIEELKQNDAQLAGDLEALVRKLRG